MHRIQVVDSHTAGEPTRVVVAGGPDLGPGTLADRLRIFRSQYDHIRSAVVNEPRGSDVVVGALLCAPTDPTSTAGVIFFNNVGFLGMCGHGMIGVVTTLAELGRLSVGMHRIETPVGSVAAELHPDQSVTIENVVSYRLAKDVTVSISGLGAVRGDVAWGGNWFYLVGEHQEELVLSNIDRLTDITWRIRAALNSGEFPQVDHVELFGPPQQPESHARNFVLCPGKAYDRSPCGTGTSAKLACLAADEKLAAGQSWVQESILGTMFRASYRWENQAAGRIIPSISGTAYVTAEAQLVLNERDPFRWGIRNG